MSKSTPAASARPSYGVLWWLVGATFVVILNETIMINAIPKLKGSFKIDDPTAQWLSTAFMLTMAVVIPMTGWFLQRVTTRTAFLSAMVSFMVGTVMCGAAPVFTFLLAGRVIQAVGTAVMLPLVMTTLMSVVLEKDRGRIMGFVTLAISVAPAMGPAASGIILQSGSWRNIFWVVLVVAVVLTVAGYMNLPNIGEAMESTLDFFSIALSAFGFGALVYGLSELGRSSMAYVLIAVGLVGVGVFAVRQIQLQRGRTPLLDLRTFTYRTFTLSLLVMALAFMGMLAGMYLLPLYFQQVLNLSPLATGVLMIPGGLAMGLLGPVSGSVYDRFGARVVVIPGAVGLIIGLVLMAQVTATTSQWFVMGAHIVLMVSLAMLFTPVFTMGLGVLPPHLYPHGSSILGALQQVAGAMGTAIAVAVMTARADSLKDSGSAVPDAMASGMSLAFWVAAGISVVVLVAALMLPNRVPSS